MKKLFSATLFLTVLSFSIKAQTLFTYGNKPVSKQEFLTSFNKNPPKTNRQEALKEYFNLYINYKLKVQSALDDRLNEVPSFKTESLNFKRQIAENYVNEEANLSTLLKETFERGQKDIHVAQVFIEFGKDTLQAYQQIKKAYSALKAGKDFGTVAATFCSDESDRKVKGELGYITVFSLSYEIENGIYALKPGTFSSIYKGKYGFHIFKNVSERPSVGKRKIAQIVFTYPPDASQTDKEKTALLADSVYNVLKKDSSSFNEMVQLFSGDRSSNRNNGILPEIGVGEYNNEFEEQIYLLKTVGEISKPFLSDQGYHILKLIEIIPFPKKLDESKPAQSIKRKIENGDRLVYAKRNLITKWMTLTGLKAEKIDDDELWSYTDSASNHRPVSSFKNINDSTVLFSFLKQKVHAKDFVTYVINFLRKSRSDISKKAYADVFKDFVDFNIGDYYRSHIDDYNEKAKQQVKEFDEANLLFAAMDKNVWNKSGRDSVGLLNYYEKYQSKYQWAPGVAGILVSASSKQVANEVANKIKQEPNSWRSIISNYKATVTADSSRFENNQLAFKQKIENKKGFISIPERRDSEELYTFIYVTEVYNNITQRSFEESKGMIINDYQTLLEETWLTGLKKKYPIKVNDEIWKSIK